MIKEMRLMTETAVENEQSEQVQAVLSRCWVCECLSACRVWWSRVPGSGLGGPADDAGDLVPDGEADGHLGTVVVCGHQVAAGSEVG
ncbi:hypothetical protein SPILM97S_00195 [Streptomyces pilosus]